MGASILGYGYLNYRYKKEALEQKVRSEEQAKKEEELYQRTEDCARIGKQFHSDKVKNPPRFVESGTHWYLEPEFYYNPELKKCLYNSALMFMDDSGNSFEEWIIDVNTGKYLARLLEHNNENVGIAADGSRCEACMTKAEFNLQKNILLNR